MSIESEVHERRITNPTTGGQKGTKLARFDLIPVGPLTRLAEHYGRGAQKYDDRNWELGYDWSLSYAAAQRHLTAWWGGEDVDPETGSNHLDAVMFHVFALREYGGTHPELDDRPTSYKGPQVRVCDPELERLLAEEEAIERRAREAVQEQWAEDTGGLYPAREPFNQTVPDVGGADLLGWDKPYTQRRRGW